jgi:GNAT superfamily N-acetyltransferase
MDDAELFARQHRSLRAFYRVIAAGLPDSRLIDEPDLTAAVVPVAPHRSIFNAVVYESGNALERMLGKLTGTYDEAGVHAWMVWTPAADRETVALLQAAGHRLDANPAAMALVLRDFEPGKLTELELDQPGSIDDVARLNDAAYGYDGDFARALAQLPPEAAYLYVARLGGAAAGSAVAVDHAGDCLITFVATDEAARGRGIATALLSRALLDARERGCETASLQATKMGQPVYERMGFRDLGALEMWERRTTAA